MCLKWLREKEGTYIGDGMICELELAHGAEAEEREEASLLAELHHKSPCAHRKKDHVNAPVGEALARATVFTQGAAPHSQPAVVLSAFENDRADLRDAHQPLIDRVARFVVANTAGFRVVRNIRIVGYADRAGVSYNLQLGARRALAVQQAIQSTVERLWPGLNSGIRYTTESAGASSSVSNQQAQARPPLNRRVEVYLSFGAPAGPVQYPVLGWQSRLNRYAWSTANSAFVDGSGVTREKAVAGGATRTAAPSATPGAQLRTDSRDGYFEVRRTSDPPFAWICWLQSNFAKLTAPVSHETGIFISPRHVLTTAHALLSRVNSSRAPQVLPNSLIINDGTLKVASVRIVPAHPEDMPPTLGNTTVAKGTAARTNPQWNASSAANHEFDYGLITLDAPLVSGQGFWGGAGYRIAEVSDQVLKNAALYTSGYPARKCPPHSPSSPRSYPAPSLSRCQLSTHGTVTAVAPRSFTHDMPVSRGQSGSPIWIEDRGERVLAGIVSTIPRQAVRITGDMLSQLQEWMKQDGV